MNCWPITKSGNAFWLPALTFDNEDNDIGKEGVIKICEALISNNSLTDLALGHKEEIIGEEGARAISELLRCNSTLTELKMRSKMSTIRKILKTL